MTTPITDARMASPASELKRCQFQEKRAAGAKFWHFHSKNINFLSVEIPKIFSAPSAPGCANREWDN